MNPCVFKGHVKTMRDTYPRTNAEKKKKKVFKKAKASANRKSKKHERLKGCAMKGSVQRKTENGIEEEKGGREEGGRREQKKDVRREKGGRGGRREEEKGSDKLPNIQIPSSRTKRIDFKF